MQHLWLHLTRIERPVAGVGSLRAVLYGSDQHSNLRGLPRRYHRSATADVRLPEVLNRTTAR